MYDRCEIVWQNKVFVKEKIDCSDLGKFLVAERKEIMSRSFDTNRIKTNLPLKKDYL